MSTLPSAEDFHSDYPPERIIGLECEYDPQYKGTDDKEATVFITDEAIEKAGLSRSGKFLSNGAGLYPEIGQHLEYDSPECLGPKAAAAADIAGALTMARIVERAGVPYKGLFRLTGSYKASNDPKKPISRTSGYHENLLIPRDIAHTDLLRAVIPSFLATRLWAMDGTLRNKFVFSQKAWGIGGVPIAYAYTRQVAHGDKPMCIIRPNDDVVQGKEWARAEIRFADAGLSPANRYLSLAVTSLIFRLLEHEGIIGSVRLSNLGLKRPAYTAKIFASDLSLGEVGETYSGRAMTALDIQEAFAELVVELSQRIGLPEDEENAIDMWLYIIDKLRSSNPEEGDYGPLTGILDIAAKHKYLLRHNSPEDLHNRNADAMQQSYMWDRVSPQGGAQKWWEAHRLSLVDYDAIERLVTEPPEDTRAGIRAYCIGESRVALEGVGWAVINLKNGRKISLHPYETLESIKGN